MNVQINTNNFFVVSGTIVKVHVYGTGKSANVLVGMADDNEGIKNLKYFNASMFDVLKPGMPVLCIGRIGSNSYMNKETGKREYRDNNDLIADTIKILESKGDSQKRTLEALYGIATEGDDS